nr:NB-ARC domains-containing protein [Tanacetum cinerariifolium]
MRVLVDKSLIKISTNMFSSKISLQMHDLIQAMAREIINEEFIMTGKQRRLWNSSLVYNVLSEKKVALIEAVEVLVLSLEKFSEKIQIDANDFAKLPTPHRVIYTAPLERTTPERNRLDL